MTGDSNMNMFDLKHIKPSYLRMKRQLKDFLLSEKSREFFIFLFFFFVAGGFWLLQTLNNDYETEFSVPVRLRNVPDNVVITSDPVSKLHVRVKDKGTALLNYMLGKSFYPVSIDFKASQGDDSQVQIFTSHFAKEIASQLKSSTQLLSIKPDTLEYIDTLFQPDSVVVYAPADILDTITVAYTQYLRMDQVTDTVNRHLVLQAHKGVKFVPPSIQMTLPVDIYTEKTVEVPLHGINFPADKVLRAFPSKIQVTFQVGVSRFRQITADDFHINVSYEELLQLGANPYTVRLRSIPEGVSHVRFNPTQVDFLIEQVDTEP